MEVLAQLVSESSLCYMTFQYVRRAQGIHVISMEKVVFSLEITLHFSSKIGIDIIVFPLMNRSFSKNPGVARIWRLSS